MITTTATPRCSVGTPKDYIRNREASALACNVVDHVMIESDC
ncbi:MAG: hypothetical protein VX278_09840 [Myxococcota bacterium]|nr:hypothetical protein [Myxococcota bacterium]